MESPARPSPSPRAHPALSRGTRDRLAYFRLLCLLLALLALWGVAIAIGIADAETPPSGIMTAVSSLLLTAYWWRGLRRGRFENRWLVAELTLLLGFLIGVRGGFPAFGAMYVGLQYRALFGSRSDGVLVAFAYAGVYLFGLSFLPGGFGNLDLLTVVELTVGGFGAYFMHTLSEVLVRDQARKRALQESEQRFRSVIENLREALIITDVGDNILLANARVRDVLGYEPDDIIGKKAGHLLLPESHRDLFQDRLRDRVQGKSELYEIELVRKDGRHITAEISASPYRNAAGEVTGTLGAISDISARKRLEARLRKATRLEVVGQLAGGLAHDFNNLLTVIKCHTELLLAELEPGDPKREDVAEIGRSAQRGAQLTNRLLAFGRKQFLQPRRIRLADVVNGHVAMLRQLVGSKVIVVARHEDTADPVFIDPQQIENILSTLARNASDAMPAGGRVVIDTRAVDIGWETPSASHQDMPGGRYVMLSVQDTGVGMPADVLSNLFEPFFTTKEPGAGSGLGLASVYGAVRQSGGYVTVESSPDAGTTFRIYLPVFRADAAPLFRTPLLEPKTA